MITENPPSADVTEPEPTWKAPTIADMAVPTGAGAPLSWAVPTKMWGGRLLGRKPVSDGTVGWGAGVAVGSGAGVAVGSGMGVAVGSGVAVGAGVAVGSGMGVGAGSGVEVGAGGGIRVGVGSGVGNGS